MGNIKQYITSVNNVSFFAVLFCFPKLKYCATFSDVYNKADKLIKILKECELIIKSCHIFGIFAVKRNIKVKILCLQRYNSEYCVLPGSKLILLLEKISFSIVLETSGLCCCYYCLTHSTLLYEI